MGDTGEKLNTQCEADCAGLDGATAMDLENLRLLLDAESRYDSAQEARALTKQLSKGRKCGDQSAKSRRKYERKINRVTVLREQVAALEAEAETLERSSEFQMVEVDDPLSRRAETADRRRRLEDLLRRAAQVKVELQTQKTQLRKRFRENLLVTADLRQLLDAEHKLYLANSSYFVVLKPFTLPDCKDVLQDAMEEVGEFVKNSNSVPSCGEICSWDKRWSAGPRDFRYSLRKTFYRQSAERVLNLTWQVFTTPMAWEKRYSPVVNMRIRLVQQVDEGNVVFFHEFAAMDADNDLVVESDMVLVSKFATESGPLIVLRGLDRGCVPVRDKLGPRTYGRSLDDLVQTSSQYLCWMELRQEQEDCTMTFYGVKPTVSATSCFWGAEIVQIALRWEFSVFGPKFSLPKE